MKFALVSLALCLPAVAHAASITETEAAKLADATIADWTSGDPARIKATYSRSIVGFDAMVAPLSTDWESWNRVQDGFIAAKIDRAVQKARKIQILSPNLFVVNGAWDVSSSANQGPTMTVRCTLVYQRSGAKWPIVTEHCSAAPTR